MRTTLEIDDDIVDAARDIARVRKTGLGKAISELARRGLTPQRPPKIRVINGIPTIIRPPGSPMVTSEMVRALLDADEEY